MVGGEWLEVVSWLFVGWLLEVNPLHEFWIQWLQMFIRLCLSSLEDIGRTCPCVYCLALVCWAFEMFCLDFRPTYWYWFSLSERYAPRLTHSETFLVVPTGSSCDLPLVIRVCFWLAEPQGDLPLIRSVLIWFIRSLKSGFRYRFPWCDLRTLCLCWMTFLGNVPHG